MLIAAPVLQSSRGLFLNTHFGRSPQIALIEIEGKSYRIKQIIDNPYWRGRRGERVKIVETILTHGINAVLAIELGSGAFYKLTRSGVKIYYIDTRQPMPLEEALKKFINGEVIEGKEPRELHEEHEEEE
ncbi:MAG: NifB/NifX family molybdenum-iron cluster-binding protein [Sulfolobales archaeon]